VTFCVHRLPEDGTPVPKHVGVMLIKYCVLYFISAFVANRFNLKLFCMGVKLGRSRWGRNVGV
jgi:hypothetical protein